MGNRLKETAEKRWVRSDAHLRVNDARISSLDPTRISQEYLEALRSEVVSWLLEIEREIARGQDLGARLNGLAARSIVHALARELNAGERGAGDAQGGNDAGTVDD